MNKDQTSITLKNENGEYTVVMYETEMNLDSVISNLVKPVLLATGYSSQLVDEILGEN